jgi:hypothetical protein
MARGVGFQTMPSFAPCLRFHMGRMSREESEIPKGLWAPKGALKAEVGTVNRGDPTGRTHTTHHSR